MDYKIKIEKYIRQPLFGLENEEWYIVTVREGDKLVYQKKLYQNNERSRANRK